MADEVDVELTRDASLRAAVGSVGKSSGGHIAVAILNADWMASGRGETVDPDDPIARLAAHLSINESGSEFPWPLVKSKGADHYRIDSSYFAKAEVRLADPTTG
jgi:hypothetical protein